MHSGGHYGFITNACFDPDQKVGAIALLNGFAPATLLAMELGAMATRCREELLRLRSSRRRSSRGSGATCRASTSPPTSETRRSSSGATGSSRSSIPRIRRGRRRSPRPDEPDVFVIEPGFRESGELVRFTRDETGRVVSVNVAVATLQRLEPVGS